MHLQFISSNSISTQKQRELTVKRLPRNRENIRREQDGHNPSIPENPNELKRSAQFPQTPARLRELLGSEEEAAEADEAVGCGGGNTCCGDQGGECYGRWQNCAGDEGGDDPDYDDCITGLALGGNLGDPA